MSGSIINHPRCGAPYSSGRPMSAAQHSRGCMISRVFRAVLLVLLALITMQDQRSGAQAHERPYFMPPVERDRLHGLILKEAWAKADLARSQKSRLDRRWLCRCIPLCPRWRPQGRRHRSTMAVREVWQESVLDRAGCRASQQRLFQGRSGRHPRGVLRHRHLRLSRLRLGS